MRFIYSADAPALVKFAKQKSEACKVFQFNKNSRSGSFEAPVGYVMGIGLKDKDFCLRNFHDLDFWAGSEGVEISKAIVLHILWV